MVRSSLSESKGTGSYGAELARVLTKEGFLVNEVNRPNRTQRRLHGKSDPLDAYRAVESVLVDRDVSAPKTRAGHVEALRVLHTLRTASASALITALMKVVNIERIKSREACSSCSERKGQGPHYGVRLSREHSFEAYFGRSFQQSRGGGLTSGSSTPKMGRSTTLVEVAQNSS